MDTGYAPRPAIRSKHFNVAFTERMYSLLGDYAKAKKVSMNELINRYVDDGLRRELSNSKGKDNTTKGDSAEDTTTQYPLEFNTNNEGIPTENGTEGTESTEGEGK